MTGFDILNQEIPGAVTAFFAMLMIVVGLVLLIACKLDAHFRKASQVPLEPGRFVVDSHEEKF